MPILYESTEDEARVTRLHRLGRSSLPLGMLSYITVALGAGRVISDYVKKETDKATGWIVAGVGAAGVAASYLLARYASKELQKPENANLVRHSKVFSESGLAKPLHSLYPPSHIQGTPVGEDTVVVQGRKNWEEKMAARSQQNPASLGR